MSIVTAVHSYGQDLRAGMNAQPIEEARPLVGLTVTEQRVLPIPTVLQLTLALTTGYHVGPLFIVQKRRAPVIHGGTLAGKRRRAREARATPKWLTPWQRAMIRLLYAQADRLTKLTGEMYVVDHIVPLDGKIVCGLHVHWNMRVIHWKENSVKGWGYWPDMPFDQMELL
jgi:hypothetical protein